MVMRYDARIWYWVVADRAAPDNVFSAPAAAYVPETDAGYEAFVAAGGVATNIVCDGELTDVLVKAGLPAAVCAAAGLTELTPCGEGLTQADVAALTSYLGCRVTSTGTPTIDGSYGIGPSDEVNLVGLQGGIAAGAPWLGYYRDVAGTKHVMTAPQFTELATALLGYVEALESAIETWAGGGAWVAPAQPVTIA